MSSEDNFEMPADDKAAALVARWAEQAEARTVASGFDERLKPYVADESGQRRGDLPRLGPRDDAEKAPAARQRFAELKKDVRTVAGDLIQRLQAAMVSRRGWTADEFTTLFARHRLSCHVARRLVWVSDDGTQFRIAEDRSLSCAASRAGDGRPPA